LSIRRARLLARLTADERHEVSAKARAAEAVDDEVERRVGDDEQVADSHVEEGGRRAEILGRRVGKYDRQSLGDESRALAEDEDDDDDDQHARDLVLGAAAAAAAVRLITAAAAAACSASRRLPRLARPPRAAQRRYQLVVEYDERHERDEVHYQKVHHCRVDNLRANTPRHLHRSPGRMCNSVWRGGYMGLDLRSTGCGFDSRPRYCQAATLGKSFVRTCPAPVKL